MEVLIQTEKSSLTSTKFKQPKLMNACVTEIEHLLEIRPPIMLFGKQVNQCRDVGFFSNESIGYKYSNQMAPSIPLTPNLETLLRYVNKKYNASFNGILINRYNDGTEYISAHSDDERYLDPVGVVAISHGSSRIFRVRDKKTKEIVDDFYTDNNHILHMTGDFQKEFTHEIPKERGVGLRYSFTFRRHNE